MPRLTLIGYRGCGKSTVAALLADRLGCEWVDADVYLEQRLGLSVGGMIRERGEAAFRDAEAAVLNDLLGGTGQPAFGGVLATGGGVVLRPANRDLLRERGRPVVWLAAPVDVIRSRLAADPTTPERRPGLRGSDALAEVAAVLEERLPLYRACADLTIDTSQATPPAVCDQILLWLGRETPS